ncbi:hypothetical protein J2S74_001322 [Evansella vedderi]|uniref:NADH dehydrogenase subunit 4 n=1 Tax=Evansella vedderi TaxID=38282 RepID=A0ABT9ZRT5_9BACI|nr:hypothetical protein [Evansella vedderi]MDQ0253949.1 hypothetical protein [Evansella vedderi]
MVFINSVEIVGVLMLGTVYKWIAFVILISLFIIDFGIFPYPQFVFYGLSIVGFVISILGRQTKAENQLTNFVGQLSFYGLLIVVVLYFLPTLGLA